LKEKFRDLAGRVLKAEAVKTIEDIVSSLDQQESPGARLGVALQDLRD